jgi:hypothetical protein
MGWRFDRAPDWTPADKVRLRKLVALGKTANAIADELRRSRGSVCGMIYRLGLKLSPEAKSRDPGIRNASKKPAPPKPKPKPEETFFLNGEPLTFAIVDRPCARCAVRESEHERHGCGQFAAEVTVRIR